MKGIVFNILNEMVEENFGFEAWEQLLNATGNDGLFIATETYPDDDLIALVNAAEQATSIPAAELVFAFGEYMLPKFHAAYPAFFEEGMTLRDFLLTIDQVVHVEVRKLYPNAGLPEFRYEENSPNKLSMQYQSPRKLCKLAEGLISGAAKHFGETYSIDHTTCMHNGSDHCNLVLEFDNG